MDYFLCCCPFIRILRSFKGNEGQELSTNSASESNSMKDGNEEDQDSGTASGDHGHDASVPAAPPSETQHDLESEDTLEPADEDINITNDARHVETVEDEVANPDSETAEDEHGRERNREPRHERRHNRDHEHGEDEKESNHESDESWRDQLNHGHDQLDSRNGHHDHE